MEPNAVDDELRTVAVPNIFGTIRRESVGGQMSASTIFTASDLDRKRREVLDAAKRGVARVRDTDGSSLVMETEQAHEAREAAAQWAISLHQLDQVAGMPRERRRPRDFGDLTWARYLSDADLNEMRDALWDAVLATRAERNPAIVLSVAEDWMKRAQAHKRAARFGELSAYGAGKAAERGLGPGDGAQAVRAARRQRAATTG